MTTMRQRFPPRGVGPKFNKEQLEQMYIHENMTATQIAQQLESTPCSVRATLSYMGIKKGKQQTNIVLSKYEHEYFDMEAAVREMDTPELLHKMLEIIAKDDMLAAILDDEKSVHM